MISSPGRCITQHWPVYWTTFPLNSESYWLSHRKGRKNWVFPSLEKFQRGTHTATNKTRQGYVDRMLSHSLSVYSDQQDDDDCGTQRYRDVRALYQLLMRPETKLRLTNWRLQRHLRNRTKILKEERWWRNTSVENLRLTAVAGNGSNFNEGGIFLFKLAVKWTSADVIHCTLRLEPANTDIVTTENEGGSPPPRWCSTGSNWHQIKHCRNGVFPNKTSGIELKNQLLKRVSSILKYLNPIDSPFPPLYATERSAAHKWCKASCYKPVLVQKD